MYFQDRVTGEILKQKGEWQMVNDELMSYFQTELGAMITMCESDLRKIYTQKEMEKMFGEETFKARNYYQLQKDLAKRGARIEVYPMETMGKELYNWLINYQDELVVMDFDVEQERIWIKDCEYTIKFEDVGEVYHLDLKRFTVDEVVTVVHSLGFDHKNKAIEHNERITLGESILNRTVFIRDEKSRQNVFEIENAEAYDDEELYTVLIDKIKELSSKAILNI